VDLAPTLALLFGVPIPKNSFGVVLPKLLNSLTGDFIFTFYFRCIKVHHESEGIDSLWS
jgi:hypothetical protein